MKKAPLRTKLPKNLQTFPKISFCTYRKYRPTFFEPETLIEKCSSVVDRKPLIPSCDWTSEDVAEWIVNDLGYPELKETFLQNNIDGKDLLLLEADKLLKINIRRFDLIKELTSNIRKIYKVDQDEFIRSISLPLRRPQTLYLWHKATHVGPQAYFLKLSKYLRDIKIIRDEVANAWKFYTLSNHWNRIPPYMPWCPKVMIGGIPRVNPMTGTRQRQNFKPIPPPYLLKDLVIYKIPRRKSLALIKKKHKKSIY